MEEKLYCVMDEHDAPYEDYEQTREDDLVLLELVKKHGLQMDTSSRLYKVAEKEGYTCSA